jgi:uncharacterized protein
MPELIAAARCLEGGADRGAPCTQVHRPGRDWPCFPRLFGAARGRRQLRGPLHDGAGQGNRDCRRSGYANTSEDRISARQRDKTRRSCPFGVQSYTDDGAPHGAPSKARANLRKHGVRFADAVTALEDERAISVRDERHSEERWISIGMDSLGRILVVVYTWRDERVRLISARPATRREAHQYEERV